MNELSDPVRKVKCLHTWNVFPVTNCTPNLENSLQMSSVKMSPQTLASLIEKPSWCVPGPGGGTSLQQREQNGELMLASNKFRDAAGKQAMEGPVSHWKDHCFYSKSRGQPLEGFEERNDLIWLFKGSLWLLCAEPVH